MSSTVGTLIERTKDLLLGSSREQIFQLVSSVTSTATTITVQHGNGDVRPGGYVAIDTETMYVWTAKPLSSSSATQLTVNRGMRGTAAATHSAGAMVYVNPFFTRWQIRQTLLEEIRSWPPQVFAVKTADISTTDFVRGYDLGGFATDWFFVLDVRMSPDVLNATPSDKNWASIPYRITRSANTTTFPSGNALTVTTPLGVFDSPRQIHVVYAAPFVLTTFTDSTTLISTVLVDASDLDIAPYGAAWRLASAREVRRLLTEAMGTVADLQQFPPMYALQAAKGFQDLRDSRLRDAIERLRSKYPTRRTS